MLDTLEELRSKAIHAAAEAAASSKELSLSLYATRTPDAMDDVDFAAVFEPDYTPSSFDDPVVQAEMQADCLHSELWNLHRMLEETYDLISSANSSRGSELTLHAGEDELLRCIEELDSAARSIEDTLRELTDALALADAASPDVLQQKFTECQALVKRCTATAADISKYLSEIHNTFFQTRDCLAPDLLRSGSSGFGAAYSRSEPPPSPAKADIPPPALDAIHISAVTPRAVEPGSYGIVDVVLYEEAFRALLDQIIAEQADGGKETLGGMHAAAKGTPIRVVLSSPDVEIDHPEETQVWQGQYLRFSFDFAVPEGYAGKQLLLRAAVYFADVPATRLRILIHVAAPAVQQPSVERRDVRSAFMSYATVEREKVVRIMQGIQQVRPDLDLFLDVDSLRSGEDWEARLRSEIDRRDVLYLCWSRAAMSSPFVEMEWQHALARKGLHGIEPIPLEPADRCPPPRELAKLHFSNRLLFIIPRPEK